MERLIFPFFLEELLLDYFYKEGGNFELEPLARVVAKLSSDFTRYREDLSSRYLQRSDLRWGYLLYFLPSNFFKVQFLLRDLFQHPQKLFGRKSELRVLDVGAGPGTGILGSLDFFAKTTPTLLPIDFKIHFSATDYSPLALKDCRYLFDHFSHHLALTDRCSLTTALWNIEKEPSPLKSERYDLILFINVLNEIGLGAAERIAQRFKILTRILDRHLDSEGSCLIIEPALKETSRDLLVLRDEILTHTTYRVYSPCLHNKPCPALAGVREDWCHEEKFWEPPSLVSKVDRLIGFRKDALKYSYLILRQDGKSLLDGALKSTPGGREEDIWRVVSERMEETGLSKFYICNSQGRFLIRRLNKHKSEANREFSEVSRGDLLYLEDLRVKGKDLRVEKESRVTRIVSP